MASLTNVQKRYLVQRLATYDSPSEAADALFDEFGVRIERQQANNYDASKPHARKGMARALVALFDATRKAFVAEVESIPIALKAYRLRRLHENDTHARKSRNLPLSNATLKQAAQEMGGMFDAGALGDDGLGEIDAVFRELRGEDDYLAS